MDLDRVAGDEHATCDFGIAQTAGGKPRGFHLGRSEARQSRERSLAPAARALRVGDRLLQGEPFSLCARLCSRFDPEVGFDARTLLVQFRAVRRDSHASQGSSPSRARCVQSARALHVSAAHREVPEGLECVGRVAAASALVLRAECLVQAVRRTGKIPVLEGSDALDILSERGLSLAARVLADVSDCRRVGVRRRSIRTLQCDPGKQLALSRSPTASSAIASACSSASTTTTEPAARASSSAAIPSVRASLAWPDRAIA